MSDFNNFINTADQFGIKKRVGKSIYKSPVDAFGFKKTKKSKKEDNPYPEIEFKPSLLMKFLEKRKMNDKNLVEVMPPDLLVYGDPSSVGSLQLILDPLGSAKVHIRRRIKDLKGNLIWVCKKIIIIPDDEVKNVTIEEVLADKIIKACEKIDKEPYDVAKKTYDNLKNLVLKIARTSCDKKYLPMWFIYSGIRKVSEDYYLIVYNYTGAGIGDPSGGRVEEFLINVKFYSDTGTIKIWGGEVQSSFNIRQYVLQPSEFEEIYFPTQSLEEITQTIVDMLSTY